MERTMRTKTDFNELVLHEMKRNGGDRKKAVHAVARANPEAHKEYLKDTNHPAVHGTIEHMQRSGAQQD